MSTLAIKGHPTRGSEVIALLEMLGGKNTKYCCGGFSHRIYFIDKDNNIIDSDRMHHLVYVQLTLEEFEEKFPYKVGDKVVYKPKPNQIFTIEKMSWDGSKITYVIGNEDEVIIYAYTKELQPYKEQETMIDKTKFPYEIGTRVSVRNPNIKKLATIVGLSYNSCGCMEYELKFDGEDIAIHYPTDLMKPVTTEQEPMEEKPFECIDFVKYPPNTDKFEIILGNYEIIEENGKYYAVKKKPKYPKTYEECCGILKMPNDERYIDIDVPLSYNKLLKVFTELIICHDAYWKIAGEEMRLGKSWEPDWENKENTKYCITTINRQTKTLTTDVFNYFLAFPTQEMCDAFYENFKELIEECKGLL